MNNTDNTVFLKDILICIAKIERYLQGLNFEKFQNDELITDGQKCRDYRRSVEQFNTRFSLENVKHRMAKNYQHAKPNYSRLRDG